MFILPDLDLLPDVFQSLLKKLTIQIRQFLEVSHTSSGGHRQGVGEPFLPVGAIISYGGYTAPPGFLLCNGQQVSRVQYQTLFQVIGIRYGAGDGSFSFTLPDETPFTDAHVLIYAGPS